MSNKINIAFLFFTQVLLAVGVILFLRNCGDKDVQINTKHTETKFIYDSTKKMVPVLQPPASVMVYTVPVPANINYDSIVKRFFAVYTYSQQIQDSSIRAQIFDSICQNRIVGRKFNYTWLKPIETIKSTTITLNPHGFYLGGFVDGSKTSFGLGPKISYLTKKDLIIGYDLALRPFGSAQGPSNQGMVFEHRISVQKKIKW